MRATQEVCQNDLDLVNYEIKNLLADPCTPGWAKPAIEAMLRCDSTKVSNVLTTLANLTDDKSDLIHELNR